jgi:hypothetical protein
MLDGGDGSSIRFIKPESGMPEISRFYGIVIAMYFNDHPPAHFHARYAGKKAKIIIDTLEVEKGELPPRAMKLVSEWVGLHREELHRCFDMVMALQAPPKIAPLD